MTARLRVLLVANECNPEWASVPGEAYQLYDALRHRADVTLVTHERNRMAIQQVTDTRQIVFIDESPAASAYYRCAARIARHGRVRWNLLHMLTYPVYAEFDARTFRRLHNAVENGEYDIVHAFTPILPRYPYRIVEACAQTPFILGPVNGGLPYPAAFRDIARAESDGLNRLRGVSRRLPGYRRTYARADKILCGSTFTQLALRQQWRSGEEKFTLLAENGLREESFDVPRRPDGERMRLLFVGRLVPCKGVDMLLQALQALENMQSGRFQLTIVGDGEERKSLERQSRDLGIAGSVRFAGWVSQPNTRRFYGDADIFCFPSIREFGGAVVLEAMAAGLPCLVAAYGGPAEYISPEAGFTLSIASRERLVSELIRRIEQLAADDALRSTMGRAARLRAREFTWECQASRLIALYENAIASRRHAP